MNDSCIMAFVVELGYDEVTAAVNVNQLIDCLIVKRLYHIIDSE